MYNVQCIGHWLQAFLLKILTAYGFMSYEDIISLVIIECLNF